MVDTLYMIPIVYRYIHSYLLTYSHSRPQSPSFLGHVVGRLQIKPSGSGDENDLLCTEVRGVSVGYQKF